MHHSTLTSLPDKWESQPTLMALTNSPDLLLGPSVHDTYSPCSFCPGTHSHTVTYCRGDDIEHTTLKVLPLNAIEGTSQLGLGASGRSEYHKKVWPPKQAFAERLDSNGK